MINFKKNYRWQMTTNITLLCICIFIAILVNWIGYVDEIKDYKLLKKICFGILIVFVPSAILTGIAWYQLLNIPK